jgi:hypothetical protein
MSLMTVQEFEAYAARVMTPPRLGAKLRGVFTHELAQHKVRRDWIIKGALQARGFQLVLGEPGCGKSFLTLDMALNLALASVDSRHSLLWFGRKIKACGVVYVAAEGQDDFIIRIRAWLSAKGIPPDTRLPLILIPTAVDLRSEQAQTKDLIADINAASSICRDEFGVSVDLLIVDTVNRALAGGDDAKSEHIGAFIKNCSLVKDECRVSVVGVHHLPKAGGTVDPRGHGSLKGDNDGQWFVSSGKDQEPNCWAITRLKAGPTGAKHSFRLRSVEVGIDDEGDPITSCTVYQTSEPANSRSAATTEQGPSTTPDGRIILQSDRLVNCLQALVRAIEDETEKPKDASRIPPDAKSATEARWLDEILRILPGSDGGEGFIKRATAAKDAAFEKLSRRGIIGRDKGWVWRTDKRVSGVDKPECFRYESEQRPTETAEIPADVPDDLPF